MLQLPTTTTFQCEQTSVEGCTSKPESSVTVGVNIDPFIVETFWSVITNTTAVRATTTVTSVGTTTTTVTEPQSKNPVTGFCFEPDLEVLTPCTAVPAVTSIARTSAAIPAKHNPFQSVSSKLKRLVNAFKIQSRDKTPALSARGGNRYNRRYSMDVLTVVAVSTAINGSSSSTNYETPPEVIFSNMLRVYAGIVGGCGYLIVLSGAITWTTHLDQEMRPKMRALYQIGIVRMPQVSCFVGIVGYLTIFIYCLSFGLASFIPSSVDHITQILTASFDDSMLGLLIASDVLVVCIICLIVSQLTVRSSKRRSKGVKVSWLFGIVTFLVHFSALLLILFCIGFALYARASFSQDKFDGYSALCFLGALPLMLSLATAWMCNMPRKFKSCSKICILNNHKYKEMHAVPVYLGRCSVISLSLLEFSWLVRMSISVYDSPTVQRRSVSSKKSNDIFIGFWFLSLMFAITNFYSIFRIYTSKHRPDLRLKMFLHFAGYTTLLMVMVLALLLLGWASGSSIVIEGGWDSHTKLVGFASIFQRA